VSAAAAGIVADRAAKADAFQTPAHTGTDMQKTLFSRIIEGEIPGQFVYQDEHLVAIRDINPAAPVHVLVIPRKPIPSLNELSEEDRDLAARLLMAVPMIARQEGVAESGYRTVINSGTEGGQTVPHLHIHILGGSQMRGHGVA
jgi:histidine triad (HIT) family protein